MSACETCIDDIEMVPFRGINTNYDLGQQLLMDGKIYYLVGLSGTMKHKISSFDTENRKETKTIHEDEIAKYISNIDVKEFLLESGIVSKIISKEDTTSVGIARKKGAIQVKVKNGFLSDFYTFLYNRRDNIDMVYSESLFEHLDIVDKMPKDWIIKGNK